MPTLTFGPNDHHLVLDEKSGRHLPQPGLGDADEAIARARRPVTAGELAAEAAGRQNAEEQLVAMQTENARLIAELAKTTKKSA